jgi:hypothetical protein
MRSGCVLPVTMACNVVKERLNECSFRTEVAGFFGRRGDPRRGPAGPFERGKMGSEVRGQVRRRADEETSKGVEHGDLLVA